MEVRGRASRDVAGLDSLSLIQLQAATAEEVGPVESSRRRARALRPAVRLEIRRPRLTTEGRACRVPALLTRVETPVWPVRAGQEVVVRGRWWSYEPPATGRVRSLRRMGMVSGELVPEARRVDRKGPAPAAGSRGSAPNRAGAALRRRLRSAAARRLSERLPPDVVPAALALTLAERGELDPRLGRRFADAGLAHLLAISGLHVGILAGGALGLVGLAFRRRERHLVAAVLTGGYVVWIGAPAAALRASLLFAGWSIARTRGSPMRTGELLGAAALVSLLLRPLSLLEAGFQLSFAGFGGLVVGGMLARRSLDALRMAGRAPGRRVRGAVLAFAAGAGAFAFTAPFAAAHFQRVAPIAVVSNFVGVPLVGLALLALSGALLLPGTPGTVAAEAGTASLRALFRVVEFFAGLPFGHGPAAPPAAIESAALLLVLGSLLLLAAGGRPFRALLPLAAAAGLLIARPAWEVTRTGGRTLVCSLDVGQGDAAVLRTRRGNWAVFDAGPRGRRGDAGRRVVVPFLRKHGARAVELFVLSHPHLDHLGGARALFEAFRVARVLDAGNPVPAGPYGDFLDRVAEEGITWLPARAGQRYRLDEAEILVLGPRPLPGGGERWSRPPEGANEASLAVRVRAGEGFVYVSTGDAYVEGERWMRGRWPADSLRADILKLGHHGSRTSSGAAWLADVRPEIAVISSGSENRYGHPHLETLERLEAAAVPRIWRSDRHGHLCVTVAPDGAWRLREGSS